MHVVSHVLSRDVYPSEVFPVPIGSKANVIVGSVQNDGDVVTGGGCVQPTAPVEAAHSLRLADTE